MTADRKQQPLGLQEGAGPANAGERKLEALAGFSTGVAHDLNNLLHVIKTATELLRRRLGEGNAEYAELLGMVQRNADRATSLTQELLAFSARQPLRPVVLNANRLVADMTDKLRHAAGRAVAMDTVLAGGLWPVRADAAELETALVNLVRNGRDAMPGGGKLTIETANVARGGRDYVAISVCDQGIGMSEEILARAFDPYFTTKEKAPMTGLGLSRVYGFIRQSEGELHIESQPGAGTTVTLFLPRLTQAEQADSNVLSFGAKPAPAAPARGLAGLRVLVVEDESLIGMLAEDLLEQLGCRMIGSVSSLGKALEMAKRAELDFALLDVDLAGEPVYPVAQALQARGVPFLFMSGYGGLDGPWRGRPIVQKPFDLPQLKREIERALSLG